MIGREVLFLEVVVGFRDRPRAGPLCVAVEDEVFVEQEGANAGKVIRSSQRISTSISWRAQQIAVSPQFDLSST